ncbi:MAG: glycosyltransferase family 1 protein [Mucilaginibacter sp.]|uniref:glycosyltransferase family 4 protein n=1 Tax=Mucilaginibacter sp. TaxID=1882438 RepID=UPI00326390E4
MRIGYDAKRVFLNMTGLGNYSRSLIKGIASLFPDNEYFLYTPGIVQSARVDFFKEQKHIWITTPKNQRFASLWRSKFVVKDLKTAGIQIYHGLSHEIPIGIDKTGIKSVVTIHDLIFKRYPKYFGFISRQIYQAKIKYACKHANHIIAVSQRTKDDLVELLNVDPEKVEVIYQNCDAIFRVKQTDLKKGEVKLKYNLPKKFILNVGTIEERKNLLVLIKAFHRLPSETYLVIVGKETNYSKKVKQYITRNKLANRITFIPNASFGDLPSIYQLAEIFVYPSRYEGFGIPILEALVSGTPVIAATGSCLDEAGGPDSLYVGPDDEKDLTDKISLLLSNKNLQKTMIEKGHIYAQKFEDKVLATQLMDLYTKVVNHVE